MLNIKSLIAATLLTGVAALSFAAAPEAAAPAAAAAPTADAMAKPAMKKHAKKHAKKVAKAASGAGSDASCSKKEASCSKQEGKAEAFVSAGSTGSATATALLTWRQVTGIHRPAIGTQLPNHHGGFVLLDAGASPDVDPEHLVEFAILGRAYAQSVMDRKNPKVHLVNIGEEPGKGNAFAKQAYKLLSDFEWFAGNIEGKDMFNSHCDVVLCEAFVGNVILKTAEGVAEMFGRHIKAGVPDNFMKTLYWPVKKVMAPIRKHMDYAEVGGSPLLGLNGICVIAHGRSNAKAIRNAVLNADKAVGAQLVDKIRYAVEQELGPAVQTECEGEHE